MMLKIQGHSGTCSVFRTEDGSEVFLIFTSRLYFHFCAFIVCFREYIVSILSNIAAVKNAGPSRM